jgi:FG-GAP repeat
MKLPLLLSGSLLLTLVAVTAGGLQREAPGKIPGADLTGLREAYQAALSKNSPSEASEERKARAISVGRVEDAYLKASNTGAQDFFGKVAISGDTAVVGAPFEDSNATIINGNAASNRAKNSGAAYIFVRKSGVWTQQAYLKASDGKAGDEFGFAVAISGETVVIGAFAKTTTTTTTGTGTTLATVTAPYTGAAYVFTRTDTTWTQQATLKASNPDAYDAFGYSVAVSGDTVVVGAIGESSATSKIVATKVNNTLAQAGAAYVFLQSGTTWTQQAYLKASSPQRLSHFGIAVAISGDNIVVGAPNESKAEGAAYVFTRSNAKWGKPKLLKARNANAGDHFGRAVAISGDTLIVGAPDEASAATKVGGKQNNNRAPGAGAAYLFSRTNGIWSLPVYLKSSKSSAGDAFGSAVAVDDELAAVGAPGEDGGGKNSGAAYLFVQSDKIWDEQLVLRASDRDSGDQLGSSVVISDKTVICGAEGEASNAKGVNGNRFNNSSKNSGAAYIFEQMGAVIALEADGLNLSNRLSNVDFPEASLNASVSKVFTLRNSGTTPLTKVTFTITGTDAVDFTIINTADNTLIAPGATTTFTVVFKPTKLTGARAATLECASDDAAVHPLTVTLKGTATN